MRASSAVLLIVSAMLAACSENDDIPAPRVSNVSPPEATPGALVTVGGANFCQQPQTGGEDPLDCSSVDGNVWFGTVPGVTTLWTDTAVTVEVPSVSAEMVDLYVSSTGRDSNSISFTVD